MLTAMHKMPSEQNAEKSNSRMQMEQRYPFQSDVLSATEEDPITPAQRGAILATISSILETTWSSS